ncbi:MAG: FAD-binding monooxygenase [Micrococcales bacterium]
MKFHENGFVVGDPLIKPAAPNALARGTDLPEQVDVLIAGTGPAGLLLAAQLSIFPNITTRILERREGPLQIGQADGISCKSVETFNAFGFAERIVKEAYWVNETVFWRPDPADRSSITRTGRIQDVEDGLSEFPHIIVNQARVHDFFLEFMKHSASKLEPDYGVEILSVEVSDSGSHPVTAKVQTVDGKQKEIQAKYVVGTDGARSVVRDSIGRKLEGKFQNHRWGVLDVLANTNFPDIRLKAAIQSENGSNILLIPREGGQLFRLYVDLGHVDPDNREQGRDISAEAVIDIAKHVLLPYWLDVKDIAWFSVYEVGHRVTDGFDDVPSSERSTRNPRVFIAGDACHTHSAKAGQGMNVSMQDTFNLGWKLAAVLEGRSPELLLHTYHGERHQIAHDLINFDSEWSKIMGTPPKDPEHPELGGIEPEVLQDYFIKGGRFTAGMATHYTKSLLTGDTIHQHLATGYQVGMRFHSAEVVRLADAKPMHLGHVVEADARWRIFAFADDRHERLEAFIDYLDRDPNSPVNRFTSTAQDRDSVFDVRAVFQESHRELSIEAMPDLLRPEVGKFGLRDYEKVFTVDHKLGEDIFETRGIDRKHGCVVVVRPDQYVAQVLPLDAHDELASFFAGFMLEQS